MLNALQNAPQLDPLRSELRRRLSRNPRYSLRAFARQMGMAPSALSEILRGLRPLSFKAATRISDRLLLSPVERESLLRVTRQRRPTNLKRLRLENDAFSVIADWHHFGILNLASLPEFVLTSESVSQRLGISAQEGTEAIARLERMHLLEKREGRYHRVSDQVLAESASHHSALKRHHQQFLHRAERSLFSDPVPEREFTSITVAADPRNLEQVKAEVTAFAERLSRTLGSGNQTRVFGIGIQVFPMDSLADTSVPTRPIQ